MLLLTFFFFNSLFFRYHKGKSLECLGTSHMYWEKMKRDYVGLVCFIGLVLLGQFVLGLIVGRLF